MTSTNQIPATKLNSIEISYPSKETDHTFLITEFPHLGTTKAVGFHLYEASILLAQYLVNEYPYSDSPLRVLELGSGSCGLAGLAMSINKHFVIFSDLPFLLPYLKINIERNLPTDSLYDVISLEWGNVEQIEELKKEHSLFDLVIGADVVYQKECIKPLLSTIYLTCKKYAIICAEVRDSSLVDEYFIQEAKLMGFQIKKIKMKSFPKHFSDISFLRLFKLQKKS